MRLQLAEENEEGGERGERREEGDDIGKRKKEREETMHPLMHSQPSPA